MEEPENADRPMRVIGRYALYGKLAAGGMAAVHFGRLLGPAGFSRTVAIKRLHAQYAKDPEFVAMFLDEARLAARIQHPNVVATVDVVSLEDELFLVMDYVRGESFSRLLRASRKKNIDVSIGIIGAVIAGMLHGLHAAHEAKDEQGRPLSVVHRDVSPQNVLVGVDGVPRVLDFGVAKAAARIQVTRDGQMKGKLAYMAPEQLQAKGVDRRTDVFAAGIVLWEALTGRRLFDAEEASEVLRMILSEEIPPPSAVVPSIPRNIDATVMKALTRDRNERYQTAREFAIALEEATQLASPREVGEWVERVAGDTLLHREQALAEIEAVSDISLITDSSPGFMKTLDGVSSASKKPVEKEPDEVSQWDEGPTTTFDPARASEADEATRMDHFGAPRIRAEGSSAARAPSGGDAAQARPRRGPPTTRLGLGSAKAPPARAAPDPRSKPEPARATAEESSSKPAPLRSVAPPKPGRASARPSSGPPRPAGVARGGGSPRPPAEPRMFPPPSEPPPAPPRVADTSGFDDENETTHVFDKDRHTLDTKAPDDEATRVFDKDRPEGDDEATRVFDKDHPAGDDETTRVFDKDRHPPRQLPLRPGTTKIGLGVPKEAPVAAEKRALPAPPAVPKQDRPGLATVRVERPRTPPPPPPQTVIVQEHTDPAMFRMNHTLWARTARWFWDDPSQRGVRVGAVAGVVVFFAVFFAASGHRGRSAHAPRPVPSETIEEAREPAPTPPVAEEPRGVDPSTLPPAAAEADDADSMDKKPKPRHIARATAPAEGRVAAAEPNPGPAPPAPAPPKTEPAVTAARPSEPATPAPTAQPVAATDDNLDSPYASSTKPAAAPTKAAAKPKKSASAADCSQPFTIDEDGIKRIKPQCL